MCFQWWPNCQWCVGYQVGALIFEEQGLRKRARLLSGTESSLLAFNSSLLRQNRENQEGGDQLAEGINGRTNMTVQKPDARVVRLEGDS